MVVVYLLSRVQLLQRHGLEPARLLCSWDSPGKNTGVGCHFLLQGIFPNQESNLDLLHCRQVLNQLSYKEKPYYTLYAIYIDFLPPKVSFLLIQILICFILIFDWLIFGCIGPYPRHAGFSSCDM